MTLRVLAINPGNTSTKIGFFEDERLIKDHTLRHSEDELRLFANMWEQLPLRLRVIEEFLQNQNIALESLNAIVGRGGLLRPIPSGTYRITPRMLSDLEKAERGEHASNLGAALAYALANKAQCEAFIVDPVAVDELDDIARVTGLPGIERQSLSHALNMKAVCKRYARMHQKPYAELNLIVAHLGSGTSLSAHSKGRMIDIINPKDEGPISIDRAGTLPTSALVDLCFQSGKSAKEIKKMLFGEGGIYAYFGTRDIRDVLAKSKAGDTLAQKIVDAMLYQTAKYIGEMATVLLGRVDAILLTGGMAYNKEITDPITKRVQWIAPVVVFPGEDELQALCEGACRVLRGEEQALCYDNYA